MTSLTIKEIKTLGNLLDAKIAYLTDAESIKYFKGIKNKLRVKTEAIQKGIDFGSVDGCTFLKVVKDVSFAMFNDFYKHDISFVLKQYGIKCDLGGSDFNVMDLEECLKKADKLDLLLLHNHLNLALLET